jgi:hypothetical protein
MNILFFSQDTFVIKNRFDIKKEFLEKNIVVCSFYLINNFHHDTDRFNSLPESQKILKKLP